MKIVLAPSAAGESLPFHYLNTFLIDNCLAIDAGSLGIFGSPDQQAAIRHVLLTHAHIDHVATLPVFLENIAQACRDCPTVHGHPAALDCLRGDVFNDRLFPDFVRLSSEGRSFLQLVEQHSGQPFEVGKYRVTPALVDHVVPTLAYRIEAGGKGVVVVTDTAPTPEIRNLVHGTRNLRAVFLEVSFPRTESWLAGVSRHLTTDSFAAIVRSLPTDVPVYAIHLKAKFHAAIQAELAALNLPEVQIAEPGRVYAF